MIRVTHLDDSRLQDYRHVSAKASRDRFIVEGRLLVERAVAGPLDVRSILAAEHLADQLEWVPGHLPCYLAPKTDIVQLVGYDFHRGILASVNRPAAKTLAEITPPTERAATLVICNHVFDRANLGGILRNCAAFDVDGVVLGENCADPYTRRVSRVSMGANFRLPIRETADLAQDLAWLDGTGRMVNIATVVDPAASPLHQLRRRPRRLAVVLGHEYDGVDNGLLGGCREQVAIPMPAGTDSLNVAVAAGIFLYHLQHVAEPD